MRNAILVLALITACNSKITDTSTGELCDDADTDGVCDADDVCPDGDDAVDSDNDGVPDACDPCPRSAVSSAFEWVTWDTPITGMTATGRVGDTVATYVSSEPIETSTEVFRHENFPVGWAVPNTNPTVRNSLQTSNRLSFDEPVVDPVFVFASIGSTVVPVTLSFETDIEVLWQMDVSDITARGLTGLEGYAIVAVPGTHTEIDFSYLDDESYVNFVFGFGGTTVDTDNDGQADFCDPCPDDPNDACDE